MTVDERNAEETSMIETIGLDAYGTLTRLNWLYGYGQLKSVSFDKPTGEGKVTLRRRTTNDVTRRFRIIDGTVYYRGHQGKAKRFKTTAEVLAGVGKK